MQKESVQRLLQYFQRLTMVAGAIGLRDIELGVCIYVYTYIYVREGYPKVNITHSHFDSSRELGTPRAARAARWAARLQRQPRGAGPQQLVPLMELARRWCWQGRF